VDIDSFSHAAPEVQKEVVSAVAAEPPAATIDTIVSQPARPQDEASPEFTKELELTIHRGQNPVQDALLVEIRENLPKGHAPSPSLAAFNKSFGTSYRGELLSVGYEVNGVVGGAPEILTLWKSPVLIHETGEGVSEQMLHLFDEAGQDFGNGHSSCSKKAPTSLGKSCTSLGKKLATKDKKGSFLFATYSISDFSTFYSWLFLAIFRNLRIFFIHTPRPSS
jgi:hypothetical protein